MPPANLSANLKTREMLPQDVDRCVRLLVERTPHESLETATVIDLWPKLLQSGRIKAAVTSNARGEIIGFGASAFVTDDFVRHLMSAPTPLIARQITKSMYTASPAISTVEQIATGNAGGGNAVFVLHSGLSDASPDVLDAYIIKAQSVTAFLELHRGYHVSTLLLEAFGEEEQAVYDATGIGILDDYSSFRCWDQLSLNLATRRPCLRALFRERALNMKAHMLFPLFVYHRPHCSFSNAEQRLLQHALKGHTDEELADILGLSLSAIKKQWIRIYEKAESCWPQIVISDHSKESHEGRGLQRRHLLLRVIRDCPEELTPYPRPRVVTPPQT